MLLDFYAVCVLGIAICIIGCSWIFAHYFTKGMGEIESSRLKTFKQFVISGIVLLTCMFITAILILFAFIPNIVII